MFEHIPDYNELYELYEAAQEAEERRRAKYQYEMDNIEKVYREADDV